MADTIAQVASGSISSGTKKLIEDKQNDMIMKSKLSSGEASASCEQADAKSKKSPRFRRTRKQIEIDAVKAAAAVDAAVSSLLSTPNPKLSKPRLGILVHKNLSNKRKRLLTLKNKIDFLRAKKLSKNGKKTEKNDEQEQNEKVVGQSQSQETESGHDPTRTCLICQLEMNQDVLNEHVMKHFYDSAKCCSCAKVSSNPANFVVHILTHLRRQIIFF